MRATADVRGGHSGGPLTIIESLTFLRESMRAGLFTLRLFRCWLAPVVFLPLLAAPASHSGASQKSPSAKKAPAKSTSPTEIRADVARFRARVESALADARRRKAYWGVLVADADSGETIYALNADHFFMPASNAKLFTSALALASLGPEYRFHTTLESAGALDSDGRLAGDLILIGRGDPDLSNRKFPYAGKVEHEGPAEKALVELADQATAKGLKMVGGDIVADDSFLLYDPYPAGWSVGDLFFTFGAPVSAIAFDDNTVSVTVQPGGRLEDPALLTFEPALAASDLTCAITTSVADAKPDFSVVRQPGEKFLLLRGSIPLGHPPVKLDLAMTHPAEVAAAVLKQLLEARGIRVTGTARVHHAPPPVTSIVVDPVAATALELKSFPTAASSLVLAEHVSPPLLEILRVTNKVSQNLHAELLLRTVGREKTGVGSTDAGLKTLQEFLTSAGIPPEEVLLGDGSGLSRSDLVTPQAVVALLRYAARQPWGRDFLSTLAIAGVDGTLENRMKGTAAAGLLFAKTGTSEDTRAMSGYATTLRGEHLVFAIFGNNNPKNGQDATATLDAIGEAMVETLGRTQKRRK